MSDNNDNYNKGLTSKIKIPYFDPASNKVIARAWIAYVDLARDSAGTKKEKYETSGEEKDVSLWTDKQTCTNAMLLLQGTANKVSRTMDSLKH